jgi:hypothetical protein
MIVEADVNRLSDKETDTQGAKSTAVDNAS